MIKEYLHLEHDGKLLLVDQHGNGPVKPEKGRVSSEGPIPIIRLPTEEEAARMGLDWIVKRVNRIVLADVAHIITYATPNIKWPANWAWKDSVISDSAVDPVTRESVYRTLHRVVSKVLITNKRSEILMAKVSRGFFTGCWTLPGGFVDYDEHPRDAAEREALEELGVSIDIPDPKGESGNASGENEWSIVQTAIFNEEGLNWVSFTYRCDTDIEDQEIVPKDDEISEARWFPKDEALRRAVSLFDIEALTRLDD